MGDVTRLRQVLVNLVGNAVKFTAVGEVVVTVASEVRNEAPQGTLTVTMSVRDTGIGIPPERLDRLFQAFSQVDSSTTRQYGGTGLGLAISTRLVEAMGGELSVVSTAGGGSTFTFTVDVQEFVDRRALATGSPAALLAGRTALIVEHNATNRRVLRLQLQRWGMLCTDVDGPDAALERLKVDAFDVAVLDMQVPNAGPEDLATAIRVLPNGRHLPLLVLASPQERPQPEHVSLFAAVVTKPVRSSLLRETLLQAVAPAEAVIHAIETTGGQRQEDGEPRLVVPLRILLAEDNLVNQKVAQLMLSKLGHHVDTVSNGQEAVDAVHRARYDVVLMDVQMPELDGLAATRQIRAQLPLNRQPRIAAMTANALLEDRTACTASGMDDYLAKPVRIHELAALLTSLTS